MSAMYAVYHGSEGLKQIANKVHHSTLTLNEALLEAGHRVLKKNFFDTLHIDPVGISSDEIKERAERKEINFRYFNDGTIGIALDETVKTNDLEDLLSIFNCKTVAEVLSLSDLTKYSIDKINISAYVFVFNTSNIYQSSFRIEDGALHEKIGK